MRIAFVAVPLMFFSLARLAHAQESGLGHPIHFDEVASTVLNGWTRGFTPDSQPHITLAADSSLFSLTIVSAKVPPKSSDDDMLREPMGFLRTVLRSTADKADSLRQLPGNRALAVRDSVFGNQRGYLRCRFYTLLVPAPSASLYVINALGCQRLVTATEPFRPDLIAQVDSMMLGFKASENTSEAAKSADRMIR